MQPMYTQVFIIVTIRFIFGSQWFSPLEIEICGVPSKDWSQQKWKSDESSSIPVITCGVSSNDSVIWGKFKLIWTSKGLTRRSVSDKRIKVRICAFSCCNLAVAQNYWFTDFGSSQDWTWKLSNETARYKRYKYIYQCSPKTRRC